MKEIKAIQVEHISSKDVPAGARIYDHTALSAVNTCPTWGIIRYGLHKTMPGSSRAMALEAGEAAHEAFAAIRWYQFRYKQANSPTLLKAAENQGIRLFGAERFERMLSVLDSNAFERTNLINFAIEALTSSGYYDSADDKRRTTTNISESLIAYVDQFDMDRFPLWIRDKDDPNTDIGIEIPFCVRVTINEEDDCTDSQYVLYLSGKMDGLAYRKDKLFIDENKTGARLDDSWLAQWQLSHQITGYCVAAATFTKQNCDNARVIGMRIPLGKIPHEGIRYEEVNRTTEQYLDWARWLLHTTSMIENNIKNPLSAPMYTHSCNRYFRACSFLPLCTANKEEREKILEEMTTDEWSPLNETI